MAGKKSLKSLIEGALREFMEPAAFKALNTDEKLEVLTAAIKWAAVDAKLKEAAEGSAWGAGTERPQPPEKLDDDE